MFSTSLAASPERGTSPRSPAKEQVEDRRENEAAMVVMGRRDADRSSGTFKTRPAACLLETARSSANADAVHPRRGSGRDLDVDDPIEGEARQAFAAANGLASAQPHYDAATTPAGALVPFHDEQSFAWYLFLVQE